MLRQPRRWRSWAAEKAGHGGAWERSSGAGEDGEKAGPLSYEFGELAEVDGRKSVNRAAKVAMAAAVTAVMGVGNRVLYKLALVPLKQYPFFLAQLATFGYLLLFPFTALFLHALFLSRRLFRYLIFFKIFYYEYEYRKFNG